MIKVLIADDQELIRQSLQIVLGTEKDIEVLDAVENGVEVVRSVRREKPDVILMDIRMPVLDGLKATQMIRNVAHADSMKIPIIAMTANVFEEDVRKSLEAGMNAHLNKPLDIRQMYELLAQLILN